MCMQFVAGSCGITCATSYMNTIHYTLVWNGSVFHTLGISRTEWNRGTASQFLDIVHIIYILCTHTHTTDWATKATKCCSATWMQS